MIYYYPYATDALEAKRQFTREHHYRIPHCFRNTRGTGFVLFDTKEDVNKWWKEQTGEYFYKEEYEPGTIFTQQDAFAEIERTYGREIDDALLQRDSDRDTMVLALPSVFGNRMQIYFIKSQEHSEPSMRLFMHYDVFYMEVARKTIAEIKSQTISFLYRHYYNVRFKKRIEGTINFMKR